MKTFEEAWAEKEEQGFQYGLDALELVRLGWELHEAGAPPPAQKRVSWPETWMTVARMLATSRSYDPRLKVCAIVVPADNTGILALGYNGNYRGGPNEAESLVPGQSGMLHAEQNCLVKCPFHYPVAKHLYVTHSPCRQCAKLIINGNISRVVYGERYRDASGLDLLKSAGVEVFSVEEAT
jgi:dCMP deaminase